MNPGTSGTTTIEALVALTVLVAGVLGAAGTTAHSLRTAHRADQTARAVRLVGDVMTRLQTRVGGCDGASGIVANPTGESAHWWLQPERGGAVLFIEVSYASVSRQYRDSLWSFVRCD